MTATARIRAAHTMRAPMAAAFAAIAALAILMAGPAKAVDIEEVTSPGGITAWLVQDDTADLVSMSFLFRGGAALDPDGKEGLSRMTAALLDEGAGSLESSEFRRRMEDQSITISYSSGRDSFSGTFRALNRYLDDGVDLLSLSLNEPRFDEDAVERIRGQILVGLNREKTDPNSRASKALFRVLFDEHPYGRPSDGTIEGIQSVTIDDLKSFAETRLTRDRLYIGVVGNITPERLAPILDKAFGGLAETGPAIEVPPVTPPAEGSLTVIDQDLPQSVAIFAQRGLDRLHPDYYAAYVVTYVLGGGGFSSRLVEEVREKRGLAYSTYSYMVDYAETALVMGGVSTRNDAIATSLSVIRDEWGKIAEDGITAEELENAKTYLTGSYPLRFTTTGQIADALTAIQYHDLGIDYIDRRNDYVEAVTLEEANRVAKALFDPSALSVVVVGQPEGLTPTREAPAVDG